MKPVTSPGNHGTLKPPPAKEPMVEDVVDDSNRNKDDLITILNL